MQDLTPENLTLPGQSCHGLRTSQEARLMDGRPTGSTGNESSDSGVSRRQFVTTSAAAVAGFMIVPRHVLGRGMQAPSDRLAIAVVGLGGMGGNNAQAVMSERIVAFCDCDEALLDGRIRRWQDSFNAPSETGRGRQGGGRQGGGPRPEDRWQNFGPSKAQAAANARWTETPSRDLLRRFLDDELPKITRYRD